MTWTLTIAALLLAALTAALSVALRAARVTLRAEREQHAREAQQRLAVEHLAARHAAILQNTMDGFFVLGDDYRFLEVNPAFCRMVGYTADELRQKKMTDLEVSAPSPDSGALPHWRTGLHHFTTAHRHQDGHIVHLESCVMVLRDGTTPLLVGFARDVTERCRAEQSLRRSEAQYRRLVETSRDLIWSQDLSGRWTFVNSAARTIYGCEPEEMIGRDVMEFVRPDRRERARQVLDELRAGKPRLRFDTEHVRKDGGIVYLNINAVPIHDDQGRVIGCTGTSTDITYRKEAEERLRQANARFESLVAGMPLGYILWSPDFRVLDWNPAAAAIFGYTPAAAIGQRAVDLLIPAEARAPFAQMCRALLNGVSSSVVVLVNRDQNGEKIKCEWHNTVLASPAGEPHGVATLIRDVSERERLEAQLRQAQRLESLGVLAGGIAHDFNNLLVGIMGNASLALERLPANAALRPLLERVVNAGRRATDLTQRMLAYAGRATCDVQLMDLNAAVAEMVEFATAAVSKNVSLHVLTQPDLPPLKADAGQVQQVIMNLLINAAEALDEAGGDVTVATRVEELTAQRIVAEFPEQQVTPGTYDVLEVRDTGCGIAPEIMGRIFDPFFSTKFAGRGLGLSALLGIVKAHHGAITVSSQVGQGTTFRVLFPAAAAPAAGATAAPRPVALPRGYTILVIDDEEDIRDVVDAILTSRGLSVLCAEDGDKGIDVFRRNADRIDAVLLDLNLPGTSGEAVFRALRAIKPDVKVILSTGFSEQEAALRFAGSPLAGFVHKPYTATSLVDKIGAAIGVR